MRHLLDDDTTLFQLSPLYSIPPASFTVPHLWIPFVCFFFYLLMLNLSHALLSLNFLSSPFCLYSALSQHTSFTFSSLKQLPFLLTFLPLSSFMFYLSIYPSALLSLALFPPLISLPMLWFVSPVSVRTVITAVSSLGENKVVLCSRHHKRQEKNKRKELQPKKEAERRKN